MFDFADQADLLTVIVLLILFPLTVIGLGEVASRLRQRGYGYAYSVDILRNVVLPLIAIYVIITQVGSASQESLVVKLFITAGAIVGLVAAIGILNGVLFEGESRKQVPKLFLDLGRILVVAIGIALTLNYVWGYDLSQLITALGVSSIVLGLALQDTLGNLFNGITIINERPFEIGDFVEIDGHEGRVIEVNWRAVRLETREHDMIVLPHLKVAQSAVINHSQPRREWVQKLFLGFSYDNPPNKVKEAIMQTLLATPGVLADPEPEVKVDNYADSSVNYEIEYAIDSFGAREEIRDAFMSRVWYTARRAGLEIPFPQINVHQEPREEKNKASTKQHERDIAYTLEHLEVEREAKRWKNHSSITIQEFGLGETIILQGRRQPGLYLLLAGEVRLSTTEADGDEAEIALLHRGDYFGEIIQRGRRMNGITVTATEDVRVVHLGEDILRSLVNRYPKLAKQLERLAVVRRNQLNKLQEG